MMEGISLDEGRVAEAGHTLEGCKQGCNLDFPTILVV